MRAPDVIVVGSGPNGLAAAVTMARAGLTVDVYEGSETPGGGCRTQELTLPGFHHDVCSAVHPLVAASPFFRGVDLAAAGVKLCTPPVAFAHPFDGGRAAAVVASVGGTAGTLGEDATRYRRLFAPLVHDAATIIPTTLAPLRSVPRHPIAMARFGLPGLLPASILAKRFATPEARGLLAGAAAHCMLPLSAPLSGAFGILLTTLAHEVGWPVIEGGSARLIDALVTELATLGGQVTTGRWIRTLDELPSATTVLLDVTARRFVDLAGDRLPPGSGGPCAGSGTDRASARWTGRSPDRSRGWPSRATRRRPCIWGGPWKRWWPAKQRWPPTAIRLGRTASWSSRGWSIRPGPPVGGTRCGLTAMCRRARQWT